MLYFPRPPFRLFFENFQCLQRPPSIVLIFCDKLDFQKAQRVSFMVLKTLLFLSLRCSADFRRSRLVYLGWSIDAFNWLKTTNLRGPSRYAVGGLHAMYNHTEPYKIQLELTLTDKEEKARLPKFLIEVPKNLSHCL